MKKQDGFTLLEMIVVVLIVSALFLLTVPNISRVINSVDQRACNALTKVIDSAIVQFKLDYGEYPRSLSDLYVAGYIEESQLHCANGTTLTIEDGHCVEN